MPGHRAILREPDEADAGHDPTVGRRRPEPFRPVGPGRDDIASVGRPPTRRASARKPPRPGRAPTGPTIAHRSHRGHRDAGSTRAPRARRRVRPATPDRRCPGSSPTMPRRSEPHGKWTVTRSARPTQLGRRGFDRPRRRTAHSAVHHVALTEPLRRDVSAIAAATASTPMTRVSRGARSRRATTARPSPVPTSIWTRRWRAIRSAS